MKRRRFIKITAAGTAAVVIMPAFACSRKINETGLILYTVRDEMDKDPEGTLDRIAEIGYNWLEAANYSNGRFYGFKPSEFRKKVESRGMKLISSHNSLDPENLDEVVGAASEAGLRYLVIPSLSRGQMSSSEGLRQAAEFMNTAGLKCRDNGIMLGFHNHTAEFMAVEGLIPYDLFLDNTDTELVTFQVDIAWMTASGNDPVDYFKRYPGRFALWHVKDLSVEKEDATLGDGTIDFAPVFAEKEISGMKYFFVEQDYSRTRTPLENIDISHDFLIKNILC